MFEKQLLTDARLGNEAALERLVERHRAELLACHRMLGSIRDADDAVQESLPRSLAPAGRPRWAELAANLAAHGDRHVRRVTGRRSSPVEVSGIESDRDAFMSGLPEYLDAIERVVGARIADR